MFVSKSSIDDKSAVVHVMAWKPLPEPMMTQLTETKMLYQESLNSLTPSDAYMRQ